MEVGYMNSSIFFLTEQQLSQETSNDPSKVDEINSGVLCDSVFSGQLTNVFRENDKFGSIIPIQPVTGSTEFSKCVFPLEPKPNPIAVTSLQKADEASDNNLISKPDALPISCEGTYSNPLDSSPKLMISSTEKHIEPSLRLVKSDDQASKQLENPHEKEMAVAHSEIILKGLNLWKAGKNPYSPDETELVRKIALLFSTAYHISLPDDEVLVLTSSDFSSVISIVKKLVKKIGVSELGAMVLLAVAVNDDVQLKRRGTKVSLISLSTTQM
jgi:hypothetical protein